MNLLRKFVKAFCAALAGVAMIAMGTVVSGLVFTSFFFERLSDWPKHLAAFMAGITILATLVMLMGLIDAKLESRLRKKHEPR